VGGCLPEIQPDMVNYRKEILQFRFWMHVHKQNCWGIINVTIYCYTRPMSV